jgi:hypothetical protein
MKKKKMDVVVSFYDGDIQELNVSVLDTFKVKLWKKI